MKRRNFLRNMGLGISPLLINPPINSESEKTGLVPFDYPTPTNLKDAANQDGHLMIRLEFSGNSFLSEKLESGVSVKNGHINRIKSYFFEQGYDDLEANDPYFSLHLSESDYDILVIWLDKFSEETILEVKSGKSNWSVPVIDLIKQPEIKTQLQTANAKANLLFDFEIGTFEADELGIQDNKDDYTFILLADPQGGNPDDPKEERCRMKIHNAFIEESVKLANSLKQKPSFALIVGDIVDEQGAVKDFIQMNEYLKKLDMPVLYELGNHETRYNLSSEPGYNMSGFANYFAAQKAFNGTDKLLYSFNLGKWHFVVWPDPLRNKFWENHPHYFDWLERDLEQHRDRPTFFFQHVPIQPIGINPLINYAESVFVKRTLFEILSKYNNVKYNLSGHVHIPVKASYKTAISHRGIKLINLPAAGFRARAFGENDYYGGPTQGIGIVDVKGDQASVTYKTVTREEYTYPDKLPEFDDESFPLWLRYKWELPCKKQFVNGNFDDGLKAWGHRFVYQEDEDPSNTCEVRQVEQAKSKNALYLMTKRRGFQVPGQDRLPQDINRIFQPVELEKGQKPFLSFSYKLDGENCDFDGLSGMYVWVEGFSGSTKSLNLIYTANKAWSSMGSTYSKSKSIKPIFLALNEAPDLWHEVTLNLAEDFNRHGDGIQFSENPPDKLLVSLGIWHVNDGAERPFASYFNQFKIAYDLKAKSIAGGQSIKLKDDDQMWWLGKNLAFTKIAGEHHYYIENQDKLKY